MTRRCRRLAVVLCVALTAAVSALGPAAVVPGAAAAVGDCVAASTWGSTRADFAQRVVELVNQHRAAKGLVQLTVTPSLANAAVWKARHMAAYGYMTHEDPAPPVARTTQQRLEACGYPVTTAGWGENIAAGQASPDAVMQAWLNSSGHRANIENPSFRAIGVGAAASSSGRLYWAQTFGTSTAGAATPTPVPVPGTVDCSTYPRQATVGAPTIYGRTTTSQLVGWATMFMRHDGTTWVRGVVGPVRYAYATATAPASQWLDASGAPMGTTSQLRVALSIPQSGYWLAVQMFFWYDANRNVVARAQSTAARTTGGAAAAVPGWALCLWP